MAGNCNPPFTCGGSGGFCGCNCNCIIPSPCYEKLINTFHILNAPLFDPCPGIVSYDAVIEITFTGCCFWKYSEAVQTYRVVGDGTVTISPGCYVDYQCREGNPMGLDVQLVHNGLITLISFLTTGCDTYEFEVENCDTVGIYPLIAESNCCYYSTQEFVENLLDYPCNTETSFLKKKNSNFLRNQILSRIKKVHYKP